jgi:hypothetical protein
LASVIRGAQLADQFDHGLGRYFVGIQIQNHGFQQNLILQRQLALARVQQGDMKVRGEVLLRGQHD